MDNPIETSGSQLDLLRSRRFAPFFLTQALGAFNDNIFRNALVILVTFGVVGLSAGDVDRYVNLAAGLFILPFFLFSATCGQIAEKYEKSLLIRRIKLLEIAIMGLAGIGFWLGDVHFLLGVLFLSGLQSAIFGPVKYSILPQHLHETELVGGNAWVEAATFLAILLGTMTGGWLVATQDGPLWVAGLLVAVAAIGYLAARAIPAAAPTAPDLKINWNVVGETWRNLRFLRANRVVLLSILGISWFWFYGAVFLSQLPNYTKQVLGGDESVVVLLLTVFSAGIGIGSLLCERMSGRKVELGLVPFGSIGLTVFGIDLYLARPEALGALGLAAKEFLSAPGSLRVCFDLLMLGVFGGFYIVPLYAIIQTRSDPGHRSRVIAGNNILNAAFMVAAAVVAILLLGAGLSIPQLLLTVALMNAAVALFIYSLVPEFLMRFLVWLLISVLYRVDKRGLENIPDNGPAVLVCNHVSFVDALIIGGIVRRPVRFVMYYKIFRIPVLNFIFRTARAIPIASTKEDEALMNRAFDTVAEMLAAGEVVCIFPEGGLTPDGSMQPFRAGIERIIERSPVPVVPMALRNLWKSMWSRRHDRLSRSRLPRRFRAHIGLIVGEPVPAAGVTAAGLEAQVRALRGSER